MKVLKDNVIVENIGFHSSFYERLTGLAFFFGAIIKDPALLKKAIEENKDGCLAHIQTLWILLNTIETSAEEQGLIEEVQINTPSSEA